jgi:hypothetical protein
MVVGIFGLDHLSGHSFSTSDVAPWAQPFSRNTVQWNEDRVDVINFQ